uniref:Uncharacterized protein n=1 Tax=Anguilla anguilla TaxID=7936 RepID=A0A0E9QQ95_ANGAN
MGLVKIFLKPRKCSLWVPPCSNWGQRLHSREKGDPYMGMKSG